VKPASQTHGNISRPVFPLSHRRRPNLIAMLDKAALA
jgi:hypothetical protein